MKNTVLCFVCTAMTIFCMKAQTIQPIDDAIKLSDKFEREQGLLTLYADNRDFCPYFLNITFTDCLNFNGMSGVRSYIVTPGKNAFVSFSLSDKSKAYNYRYKFTMLRGNPDGKVDIDFAYALPANAIGKISALPIDVGNRYQILFELPTDTVFACRDGVMCDDGLSDHSFKGRKNFGGSESTEQITLYHKDNSFGEYVFIGKSLVFPGQKIKMGTPIAVVENISGKYQVYFSTYYLDKKKIKEANKDGRKHSYIKPFFQTANEGKSQLVKDKEYSCIISDEMVVQDMNKRERNRFLKTKALE